MRTKNNTKSFAPWIPCLHGKNFFVRLKNETKNPPTIADWFSNIDRCLACVCTMQYEIPHE